MLKNSFILLFILLCSSKSFSLNGEQSVKDTISLNKTEDGLRIQVNIDTLLGKVDFSITSLKSDTFYWESGLEESLMETDSTGLNMLVLYNHNPNTSIEYNVLLEPIYPGQTTKGTFFFFDKVKEFNVNPKEIKYYWISFRILKSFKGVDYEQKGVYRELRSETYKYLSLVFDLTNYL
jgi:hypothetical protein